MVTGETREIFGIVTYFRVSSLAADIVIFNSNFNRNSFLENLASVIKLLPDYRPKDLKSEIESKCKVIYFPVQYPNVLPKTLKLEVLHIVWPHRWEFDKAPEDFFDVLYRLKDENLAFNVSVLGECYQENPTVFHEAQIAFQAQILNFGFVENKEEYYNILGTAHIAVSTAKHEFFGVSMQVYTANVFYIL